MSRGYGSDSVSRVGDLIREFLLEKKEAFGQEIYRYVKSKKTQRGTYESFRSNYLYKLRVLGLIERTRKGEAPIEGFERRQYWRIVPGMENSDMWRDPQGHYLQKLRKRRNTKW